MLLMDLGGWTVDLMRAEERGLEVSGSQLDTGAEQWALARGGRSPRCAKQYIAMVESRLKQGSRLQRRPWRSSWPCRRPDFRQ